MASVSRPTPTLALRAREHFVGQLEPVLESLSDAIRARMIELVDGATTTREMQERRDAMFEFDRARRTWVDATRTAWKRAMVPPTATARVRLEMANLELIGDDVVENKILASRLALAIQEKATWELNDLKTRIQHLEGGDDLANEDVLRPEAVAQLMVEQWMAVKLPRNTWTLVKDLIHEQVVPKAVESYHSTNDFLIKQGVLRDINLSNRVKRAAPGVRRPPAPGQQAEGQQPGQAQGDTGGGEGYGGGATGYGNTMQGGLGGPGGMQGGAPGGPMGPNGQGNPGGGYAQGGGYPQGGGGQGGQGGYADAAGYSQGGYSQGGSPQGGSYQNGYPGGGYPQGGASAGFGPNGGGEASRGRGGQGVPDSMQGDMGWQGAHSMVGGGYAPGQAGPTGMQGATGMHGNVADETRMQTATTPLARARARATGVLGQLKRLLTDKVAGFDPQHVTRPSPGLTEALHQHAAQVHTQVQTRVEGAHTGDGGEIVVFDDVAVQEVAQDLRQRSVDLKRKASTQSEKATIEIVALMFQSILSEERIPPAIRVWFARLQMPVLRVALAEPEFFGSLEHPARQLIDRMGSCVLGFDAATIGGSALETEIKRVVQVIEQYPETGRRVFQLVYDEFQKFLSKFLTDKGPTRKLVSVAQQVEQKETMAIQYTIEMRKLLMDVPVREEIREFLFKVWAEVLAVAAVKHGPQHAETVLLKKAAADLVWAASAKPNRADRAKVIQDLPKLLLTLRQGMALMGMDSDKQEDHIKRIGDTLADAFLSKTEAIPQARIDEMAKRLNNLEDFVEDADDADLPLDAESIELMLGIDASSIEVIAQGGSQPNAAMLSWARELQQGAWFTLDHNNQMHNVQYVWRSDRRQLHLFASTDGRSFLVQLRRLASYLQAGLLLPTEEEALTVRATRDALAKLDANPERLFQ